MNRQELAQKIAKTIECILGIILLIPPILSVFFFLIGLFYHGDYVSMKNLSGQWDWHDGYGAGSGSSMSPTPVYLGLMAIAGVYLVKDSLVYLVTPKEETTEVQAGDEKEQ